MSDAVLPRIDLPALRPEAQLLMVCARLSLSARERERMLQLVEGPLDWTCLAGLAERHGLRPLLYRHIDAWAPHAAPAPVFTRLWAWTERMRIRNRSMAAELLRILNLFEANGIPALPYKGPALAASVYGDLSLREFGDLDILLRRHDIAAAKALLLAQGFEPEYPLRPADEAALIRSRVHYHLALVHPATSVMVELHWMTDLDFPVDAAPGRPWWDEPAAAPLEEGRVRAFTSRDLLLILCLHGSKHHWMSLGWLVDVAELIRQQPQMDWEGMLAYARAHACERRLALGLYLAHALLDAPVPPWLVQRSAKHAGVGTLSAQLLRHFFDAEHQGRGKLESLRLDLALYDAPRLRARHLLRVIFAPSIEERSRWPQPRGFGFVAFPRRLLRLTCRTVASLFRE